MGESNLNNEPAKESADELRISRRSLLALMGTAAAAAALAGCDTTNTAGRDIPDPPLARGPYEDHRAYVPEFPPPTHNSQPRPPVIQLPPPGANTWGIIPRSYWTRHGPDTRRIEAMNGVSLITFHHSGDPKPFAENGLAETVAHLENTRHWHQDVKGWQDIGYHFAIDRMGRIWQLRSLRYQGQHVRYHNEHNIGVVVLGNFDMQQPTQAQKDKIKLFAKVLMKQYNLPVKRVYTHQEIVSTDCPGRAMQPYVAAARRSAFA